jgi:hypothetical protein
LLAVHVRFTDVLLVAVAVRLVGALGTVLAAGVVTVAVLDAAEGLFAASRAFTVYWYVVAGETEVS